MSGNAGCCGRGLPRREIPALYSALLQKRVFGRAPIEGQARSEDAQGDHAQESRKAAREKARAVIAGYAR